VEMRLGKNGDTSRVSLKSKRKCC